MADHTMYRMINSSGIPEHELTMEAEYQTVYSYSPSQDRDWVYVDKQGHRHHWDHGYPTLVSVVTRSYWCEDCRDHHQTIEYQCPQCHEVIEPGTKPPDSAGKQVLMSVVYRLDGEQITEERAREVYGEWLRQQDETALPEPGRSTHGQA